MGLKPADGSAAEYDLAKQAFYVYVPKAPADGGKYGVIAGLCFKDFAGPADVWPDVLERHHLIWVGVVGCDDGKPAVQRTALLLDAVHAARKLWPVDAERVYLSMNTNADAAAGTAFYYPEVFDGMIESPVAMWFAPVKGFERPPRTWTAAEFPRPQPVGPGAGAGRTAGSSSSPAMPATCRPTRPARPTRWRRTPALRRVVRHGYQATGFKVVQGLVVPASAMDHYVSYAADWFDEGVTFLDSPLEAKRQQQVAAGAARGAARAAPASPVGPIRVPTGGQVPMPGGFGF